MRAMTSPRRTSAPSCDSTHVSTPSRSDFVVDRSSSRRACAASLSSEPRSSDRPFELHGWSPARRCCARSRSCASSICACLTASSERRSASRENSPSLNSCSSPSSCACADCSSSVLTSMPAVEVDQRLLERQPGLRLLVVLDLEVLDRPSRAASTDSLTSSSTTGSPRLSCAPGRCSRRSTRASSGLESTRSTSGTTMPDAMMTASTGPVVTRAVRMRVRLMRGPHPAGQPDHQQRDDNDGQGHAERAPAAILTADFRGEVAIHVRSINKRRAALNLTVATTYDVPGGNIVRECTKACSEADSGRRTEAYSQRVPAAYTRDHVSAGPMTPPA